MSPSANVNLVSEIALWDRYAHHFPVREHLIYLNHAAVAPLCKPAADAMKHLADDCTNFGSRHYKAWLDTYEGLRVAAARLINADSSEIALVQVTVNGESSGLFAVESQALSPSFFLFDGTHVTATHLNGSYLGPADLYPGLTTPCLPGQTAVLYANGFGPASVEVVAGSPAQSGVLPAMPVVAIGGTQATVEFSGLVSPGLFSIQRDRPGGSCRRQSPTDRDF
jgi:hypothetical protein